MKKTLEGINNVLARKLKNTKPITFIKDPNDNDSVTSNPMTILNDHFASAEPKLANKFKPFSVIILILLYGGECFTGN